ncbi:Protein LIPL-1 [Aphelenchoides avenae]|nr:Protein LIPL-1 [Aphelenchus avenae]
MRSGVLCWILAFVAYRVFSAPATGVKPDWDGGDPEVGLPAPDIIRRWGYPAEEHHVTTNDGYILGVHRIPHGINEQPKSGTGKPVIFLQHGLEGCSTNWIINLPEQSAGFMYADAGFDVWLGNIRGNTYGKNHTSLNPDSHEFWQYSWDEHVQYDLPAMIDYVLEHTGQDSLYYVGHSQGTLIMFGKLSDDPSFAKKIRRVFALAPVATVKYIQGMLEYLAIYIYPELEFIWDLLGAGEFVPSGWLMKEISKFLCGNKLGEWMCDSFIFMLAGPETAQLNRTRTAVYTSHTPAGTSTQNIMHWAQMVRNGRMEKYDYRNAKKNREHYGQSHPPAYDLVRFDAPLHIYSSDADWLADEKDVEQHLLPEINPNYLVERVKLTGFSHLDFIWGLRAAKEVYEPVLLTIQADEAKRSSSFQRRTSSLKNNPLSETKRI